MFRWLGAQSPLFMRPCAGSSYFYTTCLHGILMLLHLSNPVSPSYPIRYHHVYLLACYTHRQTQSLYSMNTPEMIHVLFAWFLYRSHMMQNGFWIWIRTVLCSAFLLCFHDFVLICFLISNPQCMHLTELPYSIPECCLPRISLRAVLLIVWWLLPRSLHRWQIVFRHRSADTSQFIIRSVSDRIYSAVIPSCMFFLRDSQLWFMFVFLPQNPLQFSLSHAMKYNRLFLFYAAVSVHRFSTLIRAACSSESDDFWHTVRCKKIRTMQIAWFWFIYILYDDWFQGIQK